MRTRVVWGARCLVDCGWTATGDVKTVDLAANAHTTRGPKHPTVQEGVAA